MPSLLTAKKWFCNAACIYEEASYLAIQNFCTIIDAALELSPPNIVPSRAWRIKIVAVVFDRGDTVCIMQCCPVIVLNRCHVHTCV